MSYKNYLIIESVSRYLSTKPNVLKEKLYNNFKDAIVALNGLQSNAAYIRNRSYQNLSLEELRLRTITHTKNLLSKLGTTSDELNKLPIIHVAGTKGKGSTCAYVESILRHHGFKTGFYSSPHLMEVRERIRINGKPISYDMFSEYFWNIYNVINNSDDNKPLEYFRFLTIMAFQVFLKENVDVAVIEVGIGGEFDNTNVIDKVPVVGITSLGIDHTNLLGDTIEKIAWHKSGIIKENSNVFTVPQPIGAMKVLYDRTNEKNARIKVIEPFLCISKHFPNYPDVINTNASLATALAHSFLQRVKDDTVDLDTFKSMPETLKGLSRFFWPGRYQIIPYDGNIYYLDGAHTPESMQICSKWFKSKIGNLPKSLIFNMIGQRDAERMLDVLMSCDFDVVIFVPNISGINNSFDNKIDQKYYLEKSISHKEIWMKLLDSHKKVMKEKNVMIMPNVMKAVDHLKEGGYDCLVTGSLHLMGAALEVLDPKLTCFNA